MCEHHRWTSSRPRTSYSQHPNLSSSSQCPQVHHKEIHFLITVSTGQLLVLGLPWLQTHDPVISWKQKDIIKWSHSCQEKCLQVLCTLLTSTSIESPDSNLHVHIHVQYNEFLEPLNTCLESTYLSHVQLCHWSVTWYDTSAQYNLPSFHTRTTSNRGIYRGNPTIGIH